MIKFLVLPVVMAVAASAAAQPLDLDAIAKQPGTQVTRRGDTVEIKRGNVTVTIDKNGETGIDHSGHAVLCYWNLAIVAKISADLCYPGEFPRLSAMLGQFIDAANTFIATNSLRPVTRAQLEKNIADRSAKAAAGIKMAGVPPAQNRVCQRQREDDLVPLNAELEKYRREFQDTLKVPRPPVKNPCY
jgi:hypothetical protein